MIVSPLSHYGIARPDKTNYAFTVLFSRQRIHFTAARAEAVSASSVNISSSTKWPASPELLLQSMCLSFGC